MIAIAVERHVGPGVCLLDPACPEVQLAPRQGYPNAGPCCVARKALLSSPCHLCLICKEHVILDCDALKRTWHQSQLLSGVLLAKICISWPSQQAASYFVGGMVLQVFPYLVPSASTTGR